MIGLFGLLVLWKYQGWIIAGLVVYLWHKVYQLHIRPWRERRHYRKAAERESLIIRANHEDREWCEGGIYEGRYEGVTMPLTEPVWIGHESEPPDWSGIVRPQ